MKSDQFFDSKMHNWICENDIEYDIITCQTNYVGDAFVTAIKFENDADVIAFKLKWT